MTRRAATALHVTLILIGALLLLLLRDPALVGAYRRHPGHARHHGPDCSRCSDRVGGGAGGPSLQRSIRPTENTPELALRFRAWSALLLVVGGALILVPAIAEIWLGLGAAGVWLFAVYGAAGAIAILGVLAYSLSLCCRETTGRAQGTQAEEGKAAAGQAKCDAGRQMPTSNRNSKQTPRQSPKQTPRQAQKQTPRQARNRHRAGTRYDCSRVTDADITG